MTGFIRTEGPVISLNGAWAQNIGVDECYIDFMGDKAGIRLQYGGNFTFYTAENGALVEFTPDFEQTPMFENEINSFVECVKTGEVSRACIDTAAITARIMQAIYDSSDKHEEIKLG